MDLSGVIGDTAKVFIHRLRQVYDQKEALKEFRQLLKQDFGKITSIINKIKQDFETFH
jgi:GTP1/Obg family GTP-binding protein